MTLRWYFDFVSPFSYLHWQKLQALKRFDEIEPVPVVLGAILAEHGIRGPAEIEGKRLFTYRQALWQARREQVALNFPPAHPFNSLAALRLCIAAGTSAAAINSIFDHIWKDGQDGSDAASLTPVAKRLGIEDIADSIAADDVRATLRTHTEAALRAGVFGVPTLAIGSELFWGNDSHGLMEAVLDDPAILHDDAMARLATLPVGARRKS